MTWCNETYNHLIEECRPWRYFDPDAFSYKFKEGTPQEILDKWHRAMKIYDQLPDCWK